MLHTKFQGHPEKRTFYGFTIYGHGGHLDHVTRTMFPHPIEAAYEI